MKKYLLLTILSLFIATAASRAQGNWTDNGNYNITWYTDSSAVSTFSISTAEQLAGLAALVNNTAGQGTAVGFAGKTITLANNIDLSGKFWTPIGNNAAADNRFQGVFSGNSCRISGMVVELNNPPAEAFGGFFGYVSGSTAKVENLVVQGSVITSSSSKDACSGGITGFLNNGTIQNSAFIGTLSASGSDEEAAFSGGIAAINYKGNIYNNYVSATLRTLAGEIQEIGGIVAFCSEGPVSVQNNYFVGKFESNLNSYCSSCYFGAIVGENDVTDAHIQNNYWKSDDVGEAVSSEAPSFSDGSNIANNSAFTNKGDIDPEIYLGTAASGTGYDSLLNALNAWVDANPDKGCKTWTATPNQNKGYPIFEDQVRPHWIDYADFSWYDPEKDSLYISTPEQLAGLAAITNKYNTEGMDPSYSIGWKTIILTADIDLSGKLWTPIGKNSDNRFGISTFSGNNRSITNMEVEILSPEEDVNAGLFGYIYYNMTAVKDVKVQGSIWVSTDEDYGINCGGIAGYSDYANIRNCSFTGEINVSSLGGVNVGGIVGSGGTVFYSSHSGDIFASASDVYCGGITGSGQVRSSAHSGSLSAKALDYAYCGGIAGSASRILNSYARGSVEITAGETQYIGGVAGSGGYDAIQNNYFAGNISSENATTLCKGSILGRNESSDAKIQNNYWQTTEVVAAISSENGSTATGDNISNNITFSGTRTLDSEITLGTYTGNDLRNALNAGIDLLDIYWIADCYRWLVLEERNDDYPVQVPPSAILYVSQDSTGLGSSWADAMGDLSDALLFAHENPGAVGEIYVSNGTYSPKYDPADYGLEVTYSEGAALPGDKTFLLPPNVKLYGGFSATNPEATPEARQWLEAYRAKIDAFDTAGVVGSGTILSGVLSGTDTAFHVVMLLDSNKVAANTYLLDGFQITNGRAKGDHYLTINNEDHFSRIAGGLYVHSSDSIRLSLRHNQLIGNSSTTSSFATASGGGMYVNGGVHSISHNQLIGNSSSSSSSYGGGMYVNGGVHSISHNQLIGNSSSSSDFSYGGGMYVNGGVHSISHNQLIGNSSSSSSDFSFAAAYGGGMYVSGGTHHISHNQLIGNSSSSSSSYGGGMYVYGNDKILIFQNIISKNKTKSGGEANAFGGGVYSRDATLLNNSVYNNLGEGGAGRAVYGHDVCGDAASKLYNNIIYNTDRDTALYVSSNTAVLKNNLFSDTAWIGSIRADSVANNLFAQNPMLANPAKGNFRLGPLSPALGKADSTLFKTILGYSAHDAVDIYGQPRIQGDNLDIGAASGKGLEPQNGILYVSQDCTGFGSSWTDAHGYLSDALLFARHNPDLVKEIYVSNGTYSPKYDPADYGLEVTYSEGAALPGDKTFLLPPNVKLYGGFKADGSEETPEAREWLEAYRAKLAAFDTANVVGSGTILSGVLSDTDTAFHVVMLLDSNKVAPNTYHLDGFQITNGRAKGDHHLIINIAGHYRRDGGGLYVHSSDSIRLSLRHNQLIGNSSSSSGGGMYIYRGTHSISHNQLIGNSSSTSSYSSGGGMYVEEGTHGISHNQLIGNSSSSSSSPSLGGGMSVNGGVHSISHNQLIGNSSSSSDYYSFGGGMCVDVYGNDKILIFQNIISKNKTKSGGGANAFGGGVYSHYATLLNNSVYNNLGESGAGGAVYGHDVCSDAASILYNNIIYNTDRDTALYVRTNTAVLKNNLLSDKAFSGYNNPVVRADSVANNLLGADPLFIDANTGNFSLSLCSPAINSGDTTLFRLVLGYEAKDARDAADSARLIGKQLDMGAFECQAIPLDSLKLNQNLLTLKKDSSHQLTATVFPIDATNKNVNWKSADTNLAVVNASGLVRAKAKGEVYITAISEDCGYKDSCLLTVIIPATSVVLSQHQLNITLDSSYQLTATVYPLEADNQRLTWFAENQAIITVDTLGKVKAKSLGSSYVVVKTEDGNHTDTCRFTVIDNHIAVTGVQLNKKNLNLELEESEALIATVLPDTATNTDITWKSSDTTIVKVNQSGLVEAKGVGFADVVVITADGGFTDTCRVVVKDESIPVTGVRLNKRSISLAPSGTEILTAYVLPDSATNQNVEWQTTSPSVATVDNGLVQALTKGTAKIIVRTLDGNFRDTCDVTVPDQQAIDTNTSIDRILINGEIVYFDDQQTLNYVIDCGSTEFQVEIITVINDANVSCGKTYTMTMDKPGNYDMGFTVYSRDSSRQSRYNLNVEKRFEFEDIVVQKWNNTLIINNNAETNGGYTFTRYFWYKNENLITENQGYYSAGPNKNNTLDPDDIYRVEMLENTHGNVRTCPSSPVFNSLSTRIYPNPVLAGEDVRIETWLNKISDEVRYELYNETGQLIREGLISTENQTIKAPDRSGIYIIRMTHDDYQETQKIQVIN